MFCLECGTEIADGRSNCERCGWELASTTPMAAVSPPAGDEMGAVSEALADEYEVIEELGRGGMAIVYRGRELALDRDVAIKVLPFTFAFDNDFVERFQREARTAARLEHPHIIPIHRVGRSGNVIYFTMKYLRGESLARTLATRAALPPAAIRRMLAETGGALGYAHQHGVVHRDIKPDNIMFHETGHAVVCDFGIAKAASESKLTGTGTAIGTPHYMSPEQARAQPLDGRSDLYSLGVVAYKCLTGHVPYDAEDSYAIGIKHITEPVPAPDLETPEQRALFAVIRRLMEKAPEDRFETAEEMIRALAELEVSTGRAAAVPAAAPTSAPDRAVVVTEVAPAREITETPTTPMPRRSAPQVVTAGGAPPRRRVPAMLGTLVLLIGAGGGYVFLTQGGEDEPTIDSPPVVVATAPTVDSGAGAEAGTSANAPALGEPTHPSEPPPRPTAPVSRPVQERTPPVESVAQTARPADTAETTPPPPPDSVGRRPTNSDADSGAAPPNRRRVAPLVDSVRARAEAAGMGRLEIRGVRNRSRIFIDGQRRRGLGHNLPVGRHTVRIEHDDYEVFQDTVIIEAGKRARLLVQQQRKDNP